MTKIYRGLIYHLIITFLVLGLVASFVTYKEKTTNASIHKCEIQKPDFNRLKLATVEIKVGKAGGAGVIIKQKGQVVWVLTAKHILKQKGKVAVLLKDAKGHTIRNHNISRKDVYLDKKVDLGLLKVTVPEKKAIALDVLNLNLVNEDKPAIGQDIYTIGHPLRMHYTVNKGIISNYVIRTWAGVKNLYMVTSAPVFIGSSGGAVVNTKGELIGIMCGMMYADVPKRTYFNYMTFAIYPKEIRRFLNEVEKNR